MNASTETELTLRDELRAILSTSDQMLTAAQLYERSKIAESPAQISTACSLLYVKGDLVRTPNELGRFMYALRSVPTTVAPQPSVEPAAGDPESPEPGSDKPAVSHRHAEMLGALNSSILAAVRNLGPITTAQVRADRVVASCLSGKHAGNLTAAVSWLVRERYLKHSDERPYRYSLGPRGAKLVGREPERTGQLASAASQPVATTQVAAAVDPGARHGDRPARFRSTLLGHVQAFSDDHSDLMRDAISSQAPYRVLDALMQVRAGLDAAQRMLLETSS